MYSYKEKWYADAGRILVSPSFIGYDTSFKNINLKEEEVNIDDLVIEKPFMKYHSGKIIQRYNRLPYSEWKRYIIGWRYSNDDQMAIILNKDDSEEDLLRYNKMQEWRVFAAKLAKKIKEVESLNNKTD